MWVTTSPQTFLPTNTTPVSYSPFISFPKLPQPPPKSLSTAQLRRRNQNPAILATASPQDVGGLGQAVLSTINSGPSTGSNPTQQQEKPNKGNEISGSDILKALQKASVKKANTKKQQKKKGSGEMKKAEKNGKKEVIDYDKVRPVSIKSDWATRLVELEKRLQEFSNL
uniref:Uncharacterized protein n=2 Tax=Chenopodium quinoa TaxID=63459 RepID=A0A803M367_CHEQI